MTPTEQRSAVEALEDVLTEALHEQFGGDIPGGCDHQPSAACKEIAADMVVDYGDRIRPATEPAAPDTEHAWRFVNAALDKVSYGDSVESDLLEVHHALEAVRSAQAGPALDVERLATAIRLDSIRNGKPFPMEASRLYAHSLAAEYASLNTPSAQAGPPPVDVERLAHAIAGVERGGHQLTRRDRSFAKSVAAEYADLSRTGGTDG